MTAELAASVVLPLRSARSIAGLTQAEIAEMLGVSVATVERDWVAARGWLQRELSKGVS